MSQEQETAMYDQPTLFEDPDGQLYEDIHELGSSTVQAELEGMHIAPKRRQSLRDYGRDVQSRAQTVMRSEMTEAKRLEAELLNAQIPEAAQAIIEEQRDFKLTALEWAKVQRMVEDGIRAGLAIAALK